MGLLNGKSESAVREKLGKLATSTKSGKHETRSWRERAKSQALWQHGKAARRSMSWHVQGNIMASCNLGQCLSFGWVSTQPPSHPATLPGPRNTPSPLLSCGEQVIQFYACSRHSGQRFGNTHKCQSAATMQTQTHLSASAPDAGKMPKMKTKLCVHGNPIRVPNNCIALLCWWQTSMLHCGRFKGKSLAVYLTFLNIRKRV